MNKAEFKQAFTLAQSPEVDLSKANFDNLYGCGLKDFQATATTISAVARLIRWQAATFAGTWDMEEVESLRRIARTKFVIVGE
jgi:hypothetical protein